MQNFTKNNGGHLQFGIEGVNRPVLIPLFLGFASAVVATNVQAETGHSDHSLVVPWVNFSVYCLILFLLLRKPTVRFFAERSRAFKEHMEQAAQRLQFEKKRHVQLSGELAGLPALLEAMKKEFSADTTLLTEQLEQKNREKCARVMQSVEDTIAAEKLSGEREIRNGVVDEVLKIAERQIQDSHSVSLDREFRQKGVQRAREVL